MGVLSVVKMADYYAMFAARIKIPVIQTGRRIAEFRVSVAPFRLDGFRVANDATPACRRVREYVNPCEGNSGCGRDCGGQKGGCNPRSDSTLDNAFVSLLHFRHDNSS